METKESQHQQQPLTGEAMAMDIEFLPLYLYHKIHRNLKSSQVEIYKPCYYKEPTPEHEPEIQGEADMDVPVPPHVVYAPPLPEFREKKNWWDFVNPVYSFNNPRIRARVELLMSSRIVYVTDRKYMVKLQESIKADHLACLEKRVAVRAAEETEREKHLLLEGKMSINDAPEELKGHPVCRINQYAQAIIKQKKKKMKIPSKTWAYRTPKRRIKMMENILMNSLKEKEADRYSEISLLPQATCNVEAVPREDIEKGLMFSQEEYDRLKQEEPMIKLLREIDVVKDMYELAEIIIGDVRVDTLKMRETKA